MAAQTVSGLLDLPGRGTAFLRSPSSTIAAAPDDPAVPAHLITKHRLRAGALVAGPARTSGHGRTELAGVDTVNGMPAARWAELREFSTYEVVSPFELLRLEGKANGPANGAMRIIDLFCPVGKGQRALIVSPPKAGKTMLMQQIAHAVSANHPEASLMVLLIDERPEEVTDMRRSVTGDVFASSSDSERGSHVRLAQLVLEIARRKVEAGKHVVLLLDSLTRLGRAFNLHQRGSGRTLSGGVDARALEIPKRIFGAARALEHHGSLTIIATALVDTNSRMDELIFQEFKGTGNMELVLDRDLANERIFPAINLGLSGTRREELLVGHRLGGYQKLRRSIARLSPRDAMLAVLAHIERTPSNERLLDALR